MKKIAAFLLLTMALLTSCTVSTVYITPPSSDYGTKTAVSVLETFGNETPEPDDTNSTSVVGTATGADTATPTDVNKETETPDNSDVTDTPTPTPTPTKTPGVDDKGVKELKLDVYEVTLYVGKDHEPTVTVLPENAENKEYYLESDDPSVALIKDNSVISARGKGSCAVNVISKDNGDARARIEVTVLHTPEGEITYIEGILIANKTFALPSTYGPGVDPEAKEALNDMFAAAKKDGLKLFICSGYRTYAYQKSLYNRYVDRDGKEKADTYSARPGHSEHQTGLAFDLNKVDDSFDGTPEAIWIAEHAHEYGFIVRYPKGKQEITGYKYEPWHVRYIGVEKAKAVYESGLCLEEYLGITSVYGY